MRLVGSALVLLSAYLLGLSEKRRRQREIALLNLTAELLVFLENGIDYGASTVLELIEKASATERFNRLSFLEKAAERVCKGDELNTALCEEFGNWNAGEFLSSQDAAAVLEVLGAIGSSSEETETARLAFAKRAISESAQIKEADLAKKRGFYETVYLLAGAVVVMILM